MSNRKLYTCDRCGYNTFVKCNYDTHLMRKIPCKNKSMITENNEKVGINNEKVGINNEKVEDFNEKVDNS